MAGRAFNVFCLAGVVLAMVPISISWVSFDEEMPSSVGSYASAIEIITGEMSSSCPCLLISAALFTAAAALLLVSPLGSVLQMVGIGVFLAGAPFSISCGEAYCIWTGHPGVGTAIAMASSALPLIGMVRSWGITRQFKPNRLKERFITFGLIID